MNKKLMNLAMMCIATSVYASENTFESSSPNLDALKDISASDKQKCQIRVLTQVHYQRC